MEKASPFHKQYESISFEMNRRGAEGPLLEGSPLHTAVIEQLTAVAMQGSQSLLAMDFARLLDRFTIDQVVPERIENHNEVRTLYGVGSQYSEGDNSSCTSCAQAFLRNILPLGIAWDLTTEQITSFIEMGKGLYFALLKQAEAIRQQDRANLGESFALHQAFSAHEISQQYGLKFIGAHGERLLAIDKGGSTAPFFEGQLAQLETQLSPARKNIGATIHCQEKTYALAVLDTAHGREYVFFDSHGCPEINGGNPNAYVKYTFSRKAMAQVLSQVMPFHPAEQWARDQVMLSQREGLLDGQDPQVVIGRMNRENNPYILYQMELDEKGVLAETPHVRPKVPDISTLAPRERHNEVEKTNYLALLVLAAVAAALINFRDRLFLIITSYTGKDGQKLLSHLPTLSKGIKVE